MRGRKPMPKRSWKEHQRAEEERIQRHRKVLNEITNSLKEINK